MKSGYNQVIYIHTWKDRIYVAWLVLCGRVDMVIKDIMINELYK